jgi:CBS domain-containing protein
MKVSDVMTRNPACCTPATSLQEVAHQMLEHDCGAIPVCDADGKPIGMVTDRDIVIRAVAKGQNPVELTAKDCMSAPAVTVHQDADLDQAIDALEDHALRRVVVVDDDGKVCGMVAQADIAEISEEEAGELVHAVSTQPPSPHQAAPDSARAH